MNELGFQNTDVVIIVVGFVAAWLCAFFGWGVRLMIETALGWQQKDEGL